MGKKQAETTVDKGLKKYSLYEKSVQCVESDVDFLNEKFEEIRGHRPTLLREDFCGTGKLMCEWVKQGDKHEAHGVDLDPEPVNYGKEYHLSKLNETQQTQVNYYLENVLDSTSIKGQVIVAFNFSYFIFKKRAELVNYFKKVRESLTDDGVFFLDLFGGPESQTLVEEETEHDGFSYFWDCDKFNPITNECLFHIHFKEKGQSKMREAFTYDWRMWTFPEIREALVDAGFKKTVAYWEEDGEDGDGNGVFYASEEEENSESWIAYIGAYC